MVCDKGEEAEEEEAGGTDPKTRTPHNDVGKNTPGPPTNAGPKNDKWIGSHVNHTSDYQSGWKSSNLQGIQQ